MPRKSHRSIFSLGKIETSSLFGHFSGILISFNVTISEASIKLYQWFFENDSFCETNFIRLLTISESPESERASVLAALEEFEKNGVVKKVHFKENDYWILNKKFDAYEQNLTLSPKTAFIISEIINSYCDLIENQSEKCNPASISEKDLKNLLIIFNEMREKIFDKTKGS